MNRTLAAAAAAVIAMAVVTTTHEALGHGTACLAAGGRITLLTSVFFHCSVGSRWIDPAGPAANLAGATLAFVAMRRVTRDDWRRLLFLVAAFGWMWEAGYLLYGGVLAEGDWYLTAAALPPGTARPALVITGVLLYTAAMRVLSNDASRFGPALVHAWRAATLAAVIAALAYAPARLTSARQAALEIGAASLPLLFLARRRGARAEVEASPWWMAAAALVYAAFVATLGRGLH